MATSPIMRERFICVTIFRNCASSRNRFTSDCRHITHSLRKSVGRKQQSWRQNPKVWPVRKRENVLNDSFGELLRHYGRKTLSLCHASCSVAGRNGCSSGS